MQGSRQIVRGKVMQVSDSRWLEGHARFKATVRWKVVQGSRQQSAGRSCKVQGSSSLEGHARFKATVRCNSSAVGRALSEPVEGGPRSLASSSTAP